METYSGRWHGKKYHFGFHHDIHARANDTEIGMRCGEKDLLPMLKLVNPDFVQTDGKGHPGYTSWFSKTPEASVPPGMKEDALKQWRAATRKMGLPLHCHYSGIWDAAAGAKHPEWCVRTPHATAVRAASGQNAGVPTNETMCTRSPYLETLMIPQLLEMIDRYGIDGFWIDGDIWAVEPCYCKLCRGAFTERTGIAKPPTDPDDPNWPLWWNFTRESLEEFTTRYCDAVHAHKKGIIVCCNWLQTLRHPGAPTVPTDWISGDNAWVWGLDDSRCEARFIATRGKPWDIMLWNFYCSHGMGDPTSPWATKPVQMLMQEAAVILSFGGQVQVYQGSLRDGRLTPWVMKRLGEVCRFVKKHRTLCQDTETIPQVVVLHSEHHLRSAPSGKNLIWDIDVTPVKGAAFALLENHFGVDIMDEWALLPRLSEFPVVVAAEQVNMSEEMVKALKGYVRAGGKLLVSGAAAYDRFGGAFLGVTKGRLVRQATYQIPAADGTVPLYSETWRLLRRRKADSSMPLGSWKLLDDKSLGSSPLLDDKLLPHPAVTVNRVGRGAVAYVPADVFHDFQRNRYPLTRAFVGDVVRALAGRLDVAVKSPICVDVVLRRKGEKSIIHLINRSSGIPNQPENGAIDDIPTVGPVTVTMKVPRKPEKVSLAFEKGPLEWKHRAGKITVTVPAVHVHAAVVVE